MLARATPPAADRDDDGVMLSMAAVSSTGLRDRAPEGVAVVGADGIVRSADPTAARLLHVPVGDLVGRPVAAALPPLGGAMLAGFWRHTDRVGRSVTWHGFYAPAGRWLAVTAEPADAGLRLCVREAAALPPGPPVADGPEVERDRLAFLARVTEAMITTLDADTAATQLAQLVTPRLADWTTVTVLQQDDTVGRITRAHRNPHLLADVDALLAERRRGHRDQPGVLAALLSGRPVQLTAIDLAPPGRAATPAAGEAVGRAHPGVAPTSGLFVPLQAHGDTFGVLALINTAGRPPHTATEAATAVEVGRRAAIALENARLYTRTLEVAETLQRSLLTPPPRPPGVHIAARYRPADTHALVGGDFYDAFTRADGTTLLVVGDVVGHDVQASAAMSELRSAVRIVAYDRHGSPAQTLERVDRALTGLGFDTLATALVAAIEASATSSGERTLLWAATNCSTGCSTRAPRGAPPSAQPTTSLCSSPAATTSWTAPPTDAPPTRAAGPANGERSGSRPSLSGARFHTVLAQPGLSEAAETEEHLRLLARAEAYVRAVTRGRSRCSARGGAERGRPSPTGPARRGGSPASRRDQRPHHARGAIGVVVPRS
jgi:phosphoserine phosphatase RsbU/P